MQIFIIVILIAFAAAVIYHLPVMMQKVAEGFYQNPQSPQQTAIETIRQNFEVENKLVKELTPFYNLIVKNEAGKKSDVPGESSKYEAEVRDSIARNEPDVIPLFKVNQILEVISNLNDLPTESQLYLSYLFLPADVKYYQTTVKYLYDKGSKYYETLSSLGGKNKSKEYDVNGATATSIGISKTPEPFADCCNKPTVADITSTDGGGLKRQIDTIKKTPLQENYILDLLAKSNNRIKSLNAMTDLEPLLNKTRSVFNKLNSLVNSVNSSGGAAADTGYSKLVSGQSLDKALEGFTIPDNFAYLLR